MALRYTTNSKTMSTPTSRKLSLGIIVSLASYPIVTPIANACIMPDPVPPPKIWTINHGKNDAGNFELWIGIEIAELFAPVVTTICTCGLGLGTTVNPIPAGAKITMAGVGITNLLTHDTVFLDGLFNFSEDAATTALLESGTPDVAAGYQGADPGAAWMGFAASVDPFVPPVLGPNEVMKLWFGVEVEPQDLLALNGLRVAFAAGSQDPDHPMEIFTLNTYKVNVPDSPLGLSAITGMLLLAIASRRYKKAPERI